MAATHRIINSRIMPSHSAAACNIDRSEFRSLAGDRGRATTDARPRFATLRNHRHRGDHDMGASLAKALVAIALIVPASPTFGDVITDWNEKAVAFVTPRMPPPAAQRVVAIVQVAMFDAVNSIERRYRPYLTQLPAAATASQDAAAAAAAGSVLIGLHPQAEAELKGALTAYLSNIPNGDAKSEGIKLGEAVAAKILEARGKDGADAPDSYRPKAKPGVYIPTPITVTSMWPNVTPFAMTSPSQFRPVPP